MRINTLDKMIDISQNLSELEYQRKFIYIEFINTKPVIAYAFNDDEQLVVGRDVNKCNIIINDVTVSRTQCIITTHHNNIYVKEKGTTNPTCIKTNTGRIYLNPDEYMPVYQSDILIVAGIKMRILLIQGLDIIVN